MASASCGGTPRRARRVSVSIGVPVRVRWSSATLRAWSTRAAGTGTAGAAATEAGSAGAGSAAARAGVSSTAGTGSGSVITQDVPGDALALERGGQTNRPGWAAEFRARKAAEKAAKGKA